MSCPMIELKHNLLILLISTITLLSLYIVQYVLRSQNRLIEISSENHLDNFIQNKGVIDSVTIRAKMSFPTVFLSHGSPMLLLSKNNIVKGIWQDLPKHLPSRPKAIILFSAHYVTTGDELRIAYRDSEYKLNYDFYGFPDELYKVQFHAKGSKQLAERVKHLVTDGLGNKVTVTLDEKYNIDHGGFLPLLQLVGTTTDIPIVFVSTNINLPAELLMEIGKSIAPLRDEEIFIIGSGSEVHRINDFFSGKVFSEVLPLTSQAVAFGNALRNAIEGEKDFEKEIKPTLGKYRETFPYAEHQHPTDEHFRPLLYVAGAGINSKSRVKSQYLYHKRNPTGIVLFGGEKEIHMEL